MQSSSSDGLPAKGGQTSTIVVQSPIVPPSSYAAGGYAHAQAPEVPNVVKSAHGTIHRGRVVPTDFAKDRCTIVPRVLDRDDVAFVGVFDGTVGDHAADFVHHNICDHILGHKAFREAVAAAGTAPGGFLKPGVIQKLEQALREGYANTDSGLIGMCREKGIDYSACTSVTALLCGEVLSVAHLGDSKIVLGREGPVPGQLQGKYLTTDHKPDMPEERKRIEESGGSLAYLHGGKPFIRGGDFTARQALGDRPMQLNYSRAFGGKDLKMFGLSWMPDILQIQVTKADKVLIIASDGLWDVADADTAVRLAWESYKAGRDAAMDMVDWALEQHDLRGSIDNVTVAVAIFR